MQIWVVWNLEGIRGESTRRDTGSPQSTYSSIRSCIRTTSSPRSEHAHPSASPWLWRSFRHLRCSSASLLSTSPRNVKYVFESDNHRQISDSVSENWGAVIEKKYYLNSHFFWCTVWCRSLNAICTLMSPLQATEFYVSTAFWNIPRSTIDNNSALHLSDTRTFCRFIGSWLFFNEASLKTTVRFIEKKATAHSRTSFTNVHSRTSFTNAI